MTYVGASTLAEFREQAHFVEVSPATVVESAPVRG